MCSLKTGSSKKSRLLHFHSDSLFSRNTEVFNLHLLKLIYHFFFFLFSFFFSFLHAFISFILSSSRSSTLFVCRCDRCSFFSSCFRYLEFGFLIGLCSFLLFSQRCTRIPSRRRRHRYVSTLEKKK